MQETIIYMAAFFDMKGHIAIDKYLHVVITHKRKDILSIYKNTFGGNIGTQRKYQYHIYQISGSKAAVMLKVLLPYMRLKKEEARAAIEYQEMVGFKSTDAKLTRERILEEISMLKEIRQQFSG